MAETKELLQFLELDTREDVRSGALRIVLGLTASEVSKSSYNKALGEFVCCVVFGNVLIGVVLCTFAFDSAVPATQGVLHSLS